jgi:hypothetical protein
MIQVSPQLSTVFGMQVLTCIAAWPSTIDDFVDHVRAQK